MIKPVLQDDAFLRDVAAASEDERLFHLWWLGQSGFLLKWGGRHLLLDPYLSDSLTTKYAATDKPHVRMTERVIDPARLDFIDIVTSSHSHTDHLDPDTLKPLFAVNPGLKMVAPESERALSAARAGIDSARPIGMDDGTTVRIGDVEFTGIAAAHEDLKRDAGGRCVFLGYVIRFGSVSVWHSGDTVLYDGLAERLRPHRIDIAIAPINGSRPERRVAGNMEGPEAARLARGIGARLVIPCHYEMFEFNTVAPDAFEAAAREAGQPFRTLRAGERLTWPDETGG